MISSLRAIYRQFGQGCYLEVEVLGWPAVKRHWQARNQFATWNDNDAGSGHHAEFLISSLCLHRSPTQVVTKFTEFESDVRCRFYHEAGLWVCRISFCSNQENGSFVITATQIKNWGKLFWSAVWLWIQNTFVPSESISNSSMGFCIGPVSKLLWMLPGEERLWCETPKKINSKFLWGTTRGNYKLRWGVRASTVFRLCSGCTKNRIEREEGWEIGAHRSTYLERTKAWGREFQMDAAVSGLNAAHTFIFTVYQRSWTPWGNRLWDALNTCLLSCFSLVYSWFCDLQGLHKLYFCW